MSPPPSARFVEGEAVVQKGGVSQVDVKLKHKS